jgi:4-hydroxy-3-methylbut-2-enyl diphosphate reductase
VEEVRVTAEDEYFPPPRELRELIAAIDVAATVTLGGSLSDRPVVNDRLVEASTVLADLA